PPTPPTRRSRSSGRTTKPSPKPRSPITARRSVAVSYRAGLSWIGRGLDQLWTNSCLVLPTASLVEESIESGGDMRVGIYARVSTLGEQNPENQLIELRRYCEARSWDVFREYVDRGVSGAQERRPALDELLKDARRRKFDVLVCWRLDRLGRNLRHLILLLDDIHAL